MVAVRRIKKELREILSNPNEKWTAEPRGDEDLLKWVCTIKGPNRSPYEGGLFYLELLIPDMYPFSPPKARFLTPMYHLNVDRKGAITLDTLYDGWSPFIRISLILDTISSRLAHPVEEQALDHDILRVYREDRDLYFKNCREWTIEHAMDIK